MQEARFQPLFFKYTVTLEISNSQEDQKSVRDIESLLKKNKIHIFKQRKLLFLTCSNIYIYIYIYIYKRC